MSPSTCRSCSSAARCTASSRARASRRRSFRRLVDHLMEGRMPVDRMITFYPLADINRAAQDSNSGATIKPVLRMPGVSFQRAFFNRTLFIANRNNRISILAERTRFRLWQAFQWVGRFAPPLLPGLGEIRQPVGQIVELPVARQRRGVRPGRASGRRAAESAQWRPWWRCGDRAAGRRPGWGSGRRRAHPPSVAYWRSSVAAPTGPTPLAPGILSDGSPRSAMKSGTCPGFTP